MLTELIHIRASPASYVKMFKHVIKSAPNHMIFLFYYFNKYRYLPLVFSNLSTTPPLGCSRRNLKTYRQITI